MITTVLKTILIGMLVGAAFFFIPFFIFGFFIIGGIMRLIFGLNRHRHMEFRLAWIEKVRNMDEEEFT